MAPSENGRCGSVGITGPKDINDRRPRPDARSSFMHADSNLTAGKKRTRLVLLGAQFVDSDLRACLHAALHANVDGYGLLWTGFGVGAFAGVLTLIKLSHCWRPSIVLPMIAVLLGALLCPLFFIRQLSLAMLFLGVVGASWAPYTPMEPPCCSVSSRPRYAARSSARGIRWW